ncbi:MAG: ADOP family duplicated permease [Gemmatimonadaceae bacterium]
MVPGLVARLRIRLRSLFARGAVEREMQGEMAEHLDRSIERLMARGLSRDAARAEALREFGNVAFLQEEARDAHGVRWVHEFAEDVRYSVRALAHAPAYTIFATLILALGIGTATAIFSAVDAVLLARLPYPSDEQLVRIYEQNTPTHMWGLSVVDYRAIERYARSISAVGSLRPVASVVTAGGNTERLPSGYITAGFLDALQAPVSAGRRLTANDERPDAPAVALVSDRFATATFGSPTAALGGVITVDGRTHRIVGVLPRGARRLAMVTADVWPILRQTTPTRRGPFGLFVVGRLRPGVTLDAARRDLGAVSVRIFPEWRTSFQDSVARLTPYSLRESIVGRAARPLALFSAAVALVLLISVANVASLSIVRGMRRWREISMRSVLGASRSRLLRLVVTESVVLALAGAVLGLVVAWIGLALLQHFADDMPRLAEARIGWRAIAVAFGTAFVAGIAIGLVPALRLLTADHTRGAREGLRAIGDTKRSDGIRSFFVAAEFALALPILAAGALLLVSLVRLTRVDPGFEPQGIAVSKVSVPATSYREDTARARFWSSVAEKVRSTAGVDAVSLSTALPPNDDGNNEDNFDLVDSPVPPGGAQPTVSWPTVSRDFFTTFRLPLLDGRLFTPVDTGAIPVVVVTRAWAKHYFPQGTVVGREMIRGGCTVCPHTVIVGVVGDVSFDGLGAPREAVFSPITEGSPTEAYMFVRSTAPVSAIGRTVRDAVRSVDPGTATSSLTSLEDGLYESVAQPRHWTMILVAFAGAALLLAAVGIFGLLSYSVALRRREIGVRMALGAPSGNVIAWLVSGGLRFALVGTVIGLALTTVASRWLRASLYGVSPLDPTILLIVTAGLIGVAALAAWLPARQASYIDPVEAMRPD